jgi:hypothetical protein
MEAAEGIIESHYTRISMLGRHDIQLWVGDDLYHYRNNDRVVKGKIFNQIKCNLNCISRIFYARKSAGGQMLAQSKDGSLNTNWNSITRNRTTNWST